MSPFKSRQFKELEREWYGKLKESGFEDIEDNSTEERRLRSWHNLRFSNFSPIKICMISSYYSYSADLLQTHRFINEEQKRIWELHCNGLTEREIAKEVPRYKKSMVHYVISNVRKGIKEWIPSK